MNKIIALDIGGVCIHLRHADSFQYFRIPPQQLPPEFLAATAALETGKITETEWLAVFRHVTGGRFTDEQLLYGWNMIIGAPIEGMVETIREIALFGYRFVFFSDTSATHIMKLYHDADFTRLISGAVFSYETGARKPDARMYEAFEERYGKPCFYLDDKPENIAAGQQRGWTSHQFTSPAAFRQAFFELYPPQVKYV